MKPYSPAVVFLLLALTGCGKSAAVAPAAVASAAPKSHGLDENIKEHITRAKQSYDKKQYAAAAHEAEVALGYEKLGALTPELAADARRVLVRASFMAKDHATALENARLLKAAGKLDPDSARILAVESKTAAQQQAAANSSRARINERVHGRPPSAAAPPAENTQEGAAQRASGLMHSHWRPDNPMSEHL